MPHLNPNIGHSVGIISPALLVTLYQPSCKKLSQMTYVSEYATDLLVSEIWCVVKQGSKNKKHFNLRKHILKMNIKLIKEFFVTRLVWLHNNSTVYIFHLQNCIMTLNHTSWSVDQYFDTKSEQY